MARKTNSTPVRFMKSTIAFICGLDQGAWLPNPAVVIASITTCSAWIYITD